MRAMTQKLKILASLPVQYQASLYRELVKTGVGIDVCYYHHGSSGKASFDKEFGLNFSWDIDLLSGYDHFFLNKGRATFGFSEQIRIAPRLFFWCLQNRKTPVLIMGWFAETIWLFWLIRILFRMPVFVFGDNTPHYYASNPRPSWREKLLKWLLQRTTAVFYVGSENRKFWQNLGVKNTQLFFTPHSVDNQRFSIEFARLANQRQQLCLQYEIDPNLPTFLFCGKLIPVKQPIALLEAFIAANLENQAQLLFIGDGILRSEIEAFIENHTLKNVHLLGFFNQSQIPTAYVLGEILCLVSYWETWGLVVNEAMACGRPVIVTDTVGCAPDLVHPENGWIVKSLSNSLENTLMDAYERYDEWANMGQMSYKLILDNTFVKMALGIQEALLALSSQSN